MSQEYLLYPEDLNTSKAVGVKIPFNRNAYSKTIQEAYNAPPARDVGPFQLSYSTEDQAISNMVNLLFTRKGERVYHPEFGTILRDFLFEMNDEINRLILEDDLRESIDRWLPYIFVRRLEIGQADNTEFPSNEVLHSIIINITFSVFESGANRTIKIYVSETGELQSEVL